MKHPYLLTLVATSLLLSSCATQAENDRLARIGDIAIAYAERRGAISPEDASDLREAGKIVLTKDATAPEVTISTK